MSQGLNEGARWHADAATLRAYADGRVSTAAAWSAETHLVDCAHCRTLLDRALAPADQVTLAGLRATIVLPARSSSGAAPDLRRTARVALRGLLGPAWAWGVLAGLAVALLAGAAALPMPYGSAPRAGALAVAPLLPVAIVAAVYAVADDDPAIRTTTRGGLEVVLLRTAAVLVGALPLVGAAQLLVGVTSVTWLLPSLVLTAAALLLGTWTGVERGALLVAGGWTVLVMTASLGGAARVDLGPVVDLVRLTPLWAGLLVATSAALLLRRGSFDTPGRVL